MRSEPDDGFEDKPVDLTLIGRKRSYDYLTLRGLSTITGNRAEELDICLLKELVDNALDALEELDPKGGDVDIVFTTEDEMMQIKVTDNGPGLDLDKLSKITDFNRFYSSKYFFKIPKRGALGNAFKVLLGSHYAIASEMGQEPMKHPIQVRSQDMLHSIGISLDSQEVAARISSVSEPFLGTEVAVNLHVFDEFWGWNQIYIDMVMGYALFNPQTSFKLELIHPQANEGSLVREFPAVGNPVNQFRGKPSIHWLSLSEFRELVNALENESIIRGGEQLIDRLVERIKGFSSPDKRAQVLDSVGLDKHAPLSNLQDDDKLLVQLFKSLLENSARPKPNILTRIGEKQMLDRLEEVYGEPVGYKYKHVKGDAGTGDVSLPYLIEVMVVVIKSRIFEERKVIVGINRSPCLANPFSRTLLKWKKGKEEAEIHGLYGMLDKCHVKEEDPVLVIIHLSSPSVSYINYGKTEIDTKPFAYDLADTLYKASKFYYSFKRGPGRGFGEKSEARKLLVKEIDRRIGVNKSLGYIPEGMWTTQQSLYYKIRKLMGGDIGIKRDSLIDAIRVECERKGYKRLELGIITADRAELHFRGKDYPISWNRINMLSEMGSDILVVEKEGISVALAPYADRKGVALLTSRGFLVEYAKDLINLMEEGRANIYLLTDYDASGISISSKVPGIPRVGVGIDTCDGLGLKLREVIEIYRSTKEHLSDVPEENREFLSRYRVEIDSILAAAGTERLWSYLEKKMKELAPLRDLARSLDLTAKLPEEFQEKLNEISSTLTSYSDPYRNYIREKLASWPHGFVEIDEKEAEIQRQLTELVTQSPKYKTTLLTLIKLVKDIKT